MGKQSSDSQWLIIIHHYRLIEMIMIIDYETSFLIIWKSRMDVFLY